MSYEAARDRLARTLRDAPPGARVRLAKKTSNLFRFRSPNRGISLDAAPFSRVLSVDPVARTADVGGTTTYEDLVDATLRHGLMPLVVPQLKTITLGGAVAGVGIESSSFKHGLPHESLLEAEVVTGDGRVVVATPDGEHADLYRGLPNSYGTLGYAVRLTIELTPVKRFVRLRHERYDEAKLAAERIAELVAAPDSLDFLDGVAFEPGEVYLTLGTFVDSAPRVSDYTGSRVYYRSIRSRREDFLTARDYIWRWDTDWFWVSRALGLQNPIVRSLWPRRWRRSDVYRRLIALDEHVGFSRGIDWIRNRPRTEKVIQDVEVPVDRIHDFLEFLDRQTHQRPVWLCPFRTRDGASTWPLFPLDPAQTYVNIGFWGTAPLPRGAYEGFHNRQIEHEVARLGGAKSLYSTSYYDPDMFHELYGGETYRELKEQYDPCGRLLDLYDKTVRAR
jgi:FAD/FMN-containing dehydrogenase